MSIQEPQIIECVLNLSEGRNLSHIQDVSCLINETEDCQMLHRDIGWDAHRTVLTIVGGVSGVLEAVEKIIVYALSHFDIRRHEGVHPCVGITDVIPFVPLQGMSDAELEKIVDRFCNDLATTQGISIIAYGVLSSQPSLMTLAHIRRGGVKKLEKRIATNDISIDYGPNLVHPSQGVSCATVRPIMIAFNINIKTRNLDIAKLIAKDLRSLRKSESKIKDVRFLAWAMEEYGNCQISMNIYDIHDISMLELMNIVKDIAANYNIELNGSEMIGMTPEYGLSHYKHSIDQCIELLGLNTNQEFIPEKRILDIVLDRKLV